MTTPVTHHLKTWPQFFQLIQDGSKTAEVRLNDRNFKAGDELVLHEWNPETRAYTGGALLRIISHVQKLDDIPGLATTGWVLLSLHHGQ